jgi:hypothetical protein
MPFNLVDRGRKKLSSRAKNVCKGSEVGRDGICFREEDPIMCQETSEER